MHAENLNTNCLNITFSNLYAVGNSFGVLYTYHSTADSRLGSSNGIVRIFAQTESLLNRSKIGLKNKG